MTKAENRVFDYVIAGGGSAGCALAARLTEDPSLSVAVVEAGGHGRNLFIKMPAGNGFVFGNPKLDWGYHSVPQPGLNGRSLYFPQGKSLGGSSIVNGMIYMRGVADDYAKWQGMGLEEWGYEQLLPYFKRAQTSHNQHNAYHGTSGPIQTDLARNFGELERAFIEAVKAEGYPQLDDFNGPQRTGVARCDSFAHKGVRQSSAIAYLRNKPRNLTLLTGKTTARILFEGHTAVGIETLCGQTIRAKHEVIICQGAFATPKLLMLSGIGPADHLRSHGITPLVDLPGVGANMADHVDVSMQYASDRADLCLSRYQRLDQAAWLMAKWLLNGSGPGGGSFFSTVFFHAAADPANPELEVYMTPMAIDENISGGDEESAPLLQRLGRKLLVRGRKVARPGLQIDINQERPKSLGTVRLKSNDPGDYPLIDHNYFAEADDLNELVHGVKVMRDIMAQPAIAQYHQGEMGAWANAKTDAEIIQAIRETAYTGHHHCSTARMGADNDPGAVLDAQLRVRGVDGLRVCDASAMPTQITGNLFATVTMMGEKAADMILARQPLPAEFPAQGRT